mgnify:CR=1 FL=1
MTPKQTRFVEQYLIDLNATQAAIRAGYSKKTAGVVGYENLNKPYIAAAIAESQGELAVRTELTQQMVIDELAKIGFANMMDYVTIENGTAQVDLSELTRDQAAAIGEVTIDQVKTGYGEPRVKVKLLDKRAALVDLGRHLGAFPTRLEHSGPGGGAIPVAVDVSAMDWIEKGRLIGVMLVEAAQALKTIEHEPEEKT